MRTILFPLAAAALLAGCSSAPKREDGAASPATQAAAIATDAAPATASAAAATQGGARTVSKKTDLIFFDYSYPPEAGAIAGLRRQLDAQLDKDEAEFTGQAREGRADALKNNYPFRQYGYNKDWQVVANLPGWLSLSAEHYAFMGGAHGNTDFDTLLWDKQAQRARKPLSLFTSAAALEKLVQGDLCDALDRQRAKKRGEKLVRNQDDWSTACIGLDAATVILGSSNSRTFDRIGFLIPPYNAGPYAEGAYEVTLPVTPAIMRAVKPEFAQDFSVGR